MRKGFAILLIVLWTANCSARAFHFPIKTLRKACTTCRGGALEFPTLADSSAAAQKINTFLQASVLDILPDKFKKSPFEKVAPHPESKQGLTGMSYAILRNDDKILSIEIFSEYTTAMPDEYKAIYNFDVGSGNVINLRDLFSADGFVHFREKIVMERKRQVNRFLTTLDTTTTDGKASYAFYHTFLRGMENDDLGYDLLVLKKGSILLKMMPLFADSGGRNREERLHPNFYNNTIDLDTLKPWLSTYGKCLLSARDSICQGYSVGRFRVGVYVGTIGKYPVTLLITHIFRGGVYGWYFYNKYGKDITVSGRVDGHDVQLKREQMPDEKVQESFDLKISDHGVLSGAWRSGDRSYPVHLE